MAGGQSVPFFDYEFRAKPKALWRHIPWFGDFLPYWQGSRHRFLLTIKRKGPPSEQQPLNWWILFQNRHETPSQVTIPPLQTGQTTTLSLGRQFLAYTGDTLVVISSLEPTHKQPVKGYHTLYCFHSTPKTWLFLTITVAIGTALLASLGNWLIN